MERSFERKTWSLEDVKATIQQALSRMNISLPFPMVDDQGFPTIVAIRTLGRVAHEFWLTAERVSMDLANITDLDRFASILNGYSSQAILPRSSESNPVKKKQQNVNIGSNAHWSRRNASVLNITQLYEVSLGDVSSNIKPIRGPGRYSDSRRFMVKKTIYKAR